MVRRRKLTYTRNYPVVEEPRWRRPNSPPSVAGEIAGGERVNIDYPPMMGAEDFSFHA